MRAAFNAEGVANGKDPLLLTAAVAAGDETIENGYEIGKICK